MKRWIGEPPRVFDHKSMLGSFELSYMAISNLSMAHNANSNPSEIPSKDPMEIWKSSEIRRQVGSGSQVRFLPVVPRQKKSMADYL